MTQIIEGPNSIFLCSSARLIDDDRDVASSVWARDKIIPNKHVKWILANYVEADNANRNKQYWSLDNLRLGQPTISHSPLNMNHEGHNIVGTIVASEFQYPLEDTAAAGIFNPYIEVLGAMWKFYFPDELKKVEDAYEAGALFISMECVAESISCSICKGEWAYEGPSHLSYCNHVNNRESDIEFNNPHFLGGGLITPPNRPGWGNAVTNEIARMSNMTDGQSQLALVAMQQEAPDTNLTAAQWEAMMYSATLSRFNKIA